MSLPLSLLAAVQNYAWGLPASSSLVATLHAQNASTEPDPTLPYAELWIGTHPAAPSILSNGTPLSTHLSNSNSPDLPYLFKILSVAAPLSIQAHPDRALAARLHAANPTTYRDANHKPEMSVALTGTSPSLPHHSS